MSIAIYREYIIGGCFASTIFLRRCTNIASQELLINEEIRDAEVRLIDENGNQQGIVTIDVALRMAEAADLDLVKIATHSGSAGVQNYGLRQIPLRTDQKGKGNRKNQKWSSS